MQRRREAARGSGSRSAPLVRAPAGDPPARLRCGPARRAGLPPAGPRRLLRDPHPGAGGGVRDPPRRQAGPDRRHQRADELPRLLRLLALDDPATSECSTSWSPSMLGVLYLVTRSARGQPVRAAARSPCATARTASASSATTPTWSRRLPSRTRPPWPAWPGRCSFRSSASSRPRSLGVVPSIEMVIWVALGGRGTLVRRRGRRGGRQLGEDRLLRGVPLGLAVSAGRRCSSWSWRTRRRPGRAVAERRENIAARRGQPSRGGDVVRAGGAGEPPPERGVAADRPRRPREHAARDPRPPRRVRRLPGHRRPRPAPGRRRAALPHRPQRGRQDHADRRHHGPHQASAGRSASPARSSWAAASTRSSASASAARSRRRRCSNS